MIMHDNENTLYRNLKEAAEADAIKKDNSLPFPEPSDSLHYNGHCPHG